MTTALVLSGGGSLGAVQVGMLQALGRTRGRTRPVGRNVGRGHQRGLCRRTRDGRPGIGRARRALAGAAPRRSRVARYAGPAKLKVLPPLCPLKVSAADFSHADELIARAKKSTGLWLDEGGPDLPMPERFLSMHDHPSALLPSAPRAATPELVVPAAVDDVRAGEVPERCAEDMHQSSKGPQRE